MASLDIPFQMFAPKNFELEDNDPMVRTAYFSQSYKIVVSIVPPECQACL